MSQRDVDQMTATGKLLTETKTYEAYLSCVDLQRGIACRQLQDGVCSGFWLKFGWFLTKSVLRYEQIMWIARRGREISCIEKEILTASLFGANVVIRRNWM
ncbi:hypothetical protein TRVL_01923 [Trypanosoma vivax]|nr:hypothetical protein TRVL_01923 [Trypanosoma vivax]